jgi:uncharacterized protein (TIGR03435 family)
MRYVLGIALAVAVLILAMVITAAQNLPLKFEVATIKPNPNGYIDLGNGQRVLSGRTHCHGIDSHPVRGDVISLPALGSCSVLNSTLKEMIDVAYTLRIGPVRSRVDQLIIGGPNWASTGAFDVEGKAEDPSGTTEEQLLAMLQTLLTERFKLKFHQETRELLGLVLTVSKNGSKLKEASADEQPNFTMPGSASIVSPTITGRDVPIATLINFLSQRLGRIVTDKTGLMGRYDFSMTWTPNETELTPNGAPSRATLTDQSDPSLMTALQEQLGLRLESARGPVEVQVIDSVEKPSEN